MTNRTPLIAGAAVVAGGLAVGAWQLSKPVPAPPEPPEPVAAEPTPEPPPRVIELPPAPASTPVDVPDDAFVMLDDGLKVADIVVGTGAEVEDGDRVLVDYALWTADGTHVHTSAPERPFTFEVGGTTVIQGWNRTLPGMREGGHRQARIPAALGFRVGTNQEVPIDTPLLLEVRLRGVLLPRVVPEMPAPSEWSDRASGAREAIVEEGEGPAPDEGATIGLEMTTWLAADGTLLSSTLSRAKPLAITLGTHQILTELEAVAGELALGETRVVELPPALAFGADGQPGKIPPEATVRAQLTRVRPLR